MVTKGFEIGESKYEVGPYDLNIKVTRRAVRFTERWHIFWPDSTWWKVNQISSSQHTTMITIRLNKCPTTYSQHQCITGQLTELSFVRLPTDPWVPLARTLQHTWSPPRMLRYWNSREQVFDAIWHTHNALLALTGYTDGDDMIIYD